VAKERSNSTSLPKKKSAKQEAFEREARETLEHPDMNEFDKIMRKLLKPFKGDGDARRA
jgi:hypothetical protein